MSEVKIDDKGAFDVAGIVGTATLVLTPWEPRYAIEIRHEGERIYSIKPDGTEWRSDDFSEEHGLAIMFEGFSRRWDGAGKRAVEELKARGLSVTATFRAMAIGMAVACRDPAKAGEE